MPFLRRKTRVILIVVGLFALSPLIVLAHPRARAVLRLTPSFLPLKQDSRVFYEPGAETYAERIAEALPGAIARVQECHSRPFVSDFRVYICASHKSFTRHIGHPASSPVRGTAFLWDIWVSPKAFVFWGEDTHRQTLAHELSHLHLGQHLGWWRRTKNVPAWFGEGLADWVADMFGDGPSREKALEGFFTGYHLVPDASGRLPFPKRPWDYGLTGPMLHMQSRMFVDYLRARDEESFKEFVAAVVLGVPFDVAFREHFGDSLGGVWHDFLDALKTQFEHASDARLR